MSTFRRYGNSKYWYKGETNLLHREDGPAIEHGSGKKEWWVNAQRHRLDGPAFIDDTLQYVTWWANGKRHRLDGPAIECKDRNEWWVYGINIMCLKNMLKVYCYK